MSTSGMLGQFLTDESGATAIEYGLLIAFLVLAIIAGMSAVGTGLDAMFRNQQINDTLTNAPTGG